MKKFYSLLVAAAMVMGATSCQKDAAETVATNEPVSFTATLNNTRTELGEGNKVMWNADDKITIYTQENTAGVVFDGDATEAAATATFTTTSEFAASETGYLAVYPNQAGAATYSNGVWSVPMSLPDMVDGVNNTFLENNPMAAFSNDNTLSFKAATAIIKFTYKGQASGGYADFMAMGGSVVGDKTLQYDTTNNSISYDSNGSFTMLGINSLKDGETYYIPIFPATVNNFSLTLDDGTVYSYDKEFTFVAGKIYNIKFPETTGVVSDWKLTDVATFKPQPMYTEEGYHVIKNVSDLEGGYIFMNESDPNNPIMLGASKTIVAGNWQATAEAFNGFRFSDCTPADIYLSEDASMMCVVPAGAEVPAMPEPFVSEQTLWAISGELNNWSDTFLWTTETEGLLVAQNVTFETDYSEFKFRYDSDWKQQYTSEVYGIEANKWVVADNTTSLGNTSVLTAGTYDVYLDTTNYKIYVVTAGSAIEDAVEQTISNQKPVESAGKLYLIPNANWKQGNARFAAYFFGNGECWLDMTDTDSDGCYECDIPEGYPSVIFCRMNPDTTTNNWNNKWDQTVDLTVPTDGTNCYTVKEGTWNMGGGTWSTK